MTEAPDLCGRNYPSRYQSQTAANRGVVCSALPTGCLLSHQSCDRLCSPHKPPRMRATTFHLPLDTSALVSFQLIAFAREPTWHIPMVYLYNFRDNAANRQGTEAPSVEEIENIPATAPRSRCHL
jgi:hypothetical protein